VIRVVFGVVLIRAAPLSRSPKGLRVLGSLIVVGGLLTPFIGVQFAQVILGWWLEGGVSVVRIWAGFSLLLGAYVVYATVPTRRAA
jgi:hypothetical protein